MLDNVVKNNIGIWLVKNPTKIIRKRLYAHQETIM